MPIKKAAKKYMRVTARKTQKNAKIKGAFRSAIKKTLEAIHAGNKDSAKEWFQKSAKALDKAVQKKVIHKNTAARRKSRLNAKIKNLGKK
ncbi:MAG: 30S ribosomal protein S20 [Candidatus Moranbacteria bacterium]|nr:30S ribosomal protein S20 [Candidatus Moranbacteria bacterium]